MKKNHIFQYHILTPPALILIALGALTCATGRSSGNAGDAETAQLDVPNPRLVSSVVARGDDYRGTPERFNRYYTDQSWTPTRTIYVSRNGANTSLAANSRTSPAPVRFALNNAQPGDRIYFLRSARAYTGCYELDENRSGTYDAPILLYAERNPDGTRGVLINACGTGRRTAINLEGADYIALDGFELTGGNYGVRAVGLGYAQARHQRGIALFNCHAHGQYRDPIFTGQSDWAVLEHNVARDAGSGDGHGIYLSNGGDWNIVRFNDLANNRNSDFQVNADPELTCTGEGIAYTDARCDGSALMGLGQGVSEYFLIAGNYFHNGRAQGANFTSMRNSTVENNIFAFYARHGVSFWQETDNPALGSHHNVVTANLIINTQSHVLQFINNSDHNTVLGNILIGISLAGSSATPNPGVVLLDLDATIDGQAMEGNFYVSGKLAGYVPGENEHRTTLFSPGWFARFPFDRMGTPADWTPTSTAPFDRFEGWMPPRGW